MLCAGGIARADAVGVLVGVGMGGWEGPERGDVAIRGRLQLVVTVLFRQQGGDAQGGRCATAPL